MKKIYIAAYHQSKFGKLMGMTVPQIIRTSIESTCREIEIPASVLDVASVGSACNFTLNEQGLLAGLVAMVPGLEGKPIEAVENACASGGQAALSVIQKLQLGMGDTGIALGYEKMRDAEGKADGKLIGKVLPNIDEAGQLLRAMVRNGIEFIRGRQRYYPGMGLHFRALYEALANGAPPASKRHISLPVWRSTAYNRPSVEPTKIRLPTTTGELSTRPLVANFQTNLPLSASRA